MSFCWLHLGVGGEVLADLLLVLGLELLSQLLQVGGGELHVVGDALALLHLVDELLKVLLADFHDHVGEHLDETTVGVVHKALELGVGVALDHGGDNVVVQTQVQDGVHHAGHGGAGAGADGDQQGVLQIAELLAVDLLHDLVVDLTAIFVVLGAGFGGDGEALGNGHADVGHLGQVGALAAQKLAHGSVALGEEVDILAGHVLFSFQLT